MASDIGYLLSNYWLFYLRGTASTIVLAVIGTLGGLLIGIFLGLGKNMKKDRWYKRPIVWLCTAYSTVIRGTPMMVQAMLFKYGCQAMGLNWNSILPGVDVFNGWLWAGLIVITLNTAAYMCEIVRAGLNGVDKGQYEGARSLGFSSIKALYYVTLPQALRNAIPTIGNEFIVNIKDSSVLNVIGVTELYYEAQSAANKNYMFMATYLITAVIYLVLTLLATGLLKLIEMKADGKKIKVSLFHYKAAGA